MRVYDLIFPKSDDTADDCEDRLAYVRDELSGNVRAAVADGATATAFSGEWAELLVRAYCDAPFMQWSDLLRCCDDAARRWTAVVYGEDRPWHSLMRAKAGGAAAIAGIEVRSPDRTWTAAALGDSCIFHVRDDRIRAAVPPYGADDFDNHPSLLSTDTARNAGLESLFTAVTDTFVSGDRFVLATDAAAQALLVADRSADGLRDWIVALTSERETAARFIASSRAVGSLRDDDVAIVVIEV